MSTGTGKGIGTCIYARAHAYMHMHSTCIYAHAYMHMHICTSTRTFSHAHSHAHIYAHTQKWVPMPTAPHETVVIVTEGQPPYRLVWASEAWLGHMPPSYIPDHSIIIIASDGRSGDVAWYVLMPGVLKHQLVYAQLLGGAYFVAWQIVQRACTDSHHSIIASVG